MTSNAPVVSVMCHEPDGDITREVRPMNLSMNNLRRMWELGRQFGTLFNEEIRGDFKKFVEVFLRQHGETIEANGLFWVIDDFVGMFYMTNIIPMVDADVHYTFFDKRHKGRKELVREMLKFAFGKYHFRRLSAQVPYYAIHGVMPFLESIGFKSEGRKSKAVWYRDEWWDMNLYGILSEEVLDGRD